MAEPIAVACTLTTKDAATQVIEWADLRSHMTSVERIEDGVEMTFPIAMAGDVRDLAAREATCCAFLTLVTAECGDEVELRITSDAQEAAGVIDLLAGTGEPTT
jgi:hypothetical protein